MPEPEPECLAFGKDPDHEDFGEITIPALQAMLKQLGYPILNPDDELMNQALFSFDLSCYKCTVNKEGRCHPGEPDQPWDNTMNDEFNPPGSTFPFCGIAEGKLKKCKSADDFCTSCSPGGKIPEPPPPPERPAAAKTASARAKSVPAPKQNAKPAAPKTNSAAASRAGQTAAAAASGASTTNSATASRARQTHSAMIDVSIAANGMLLRNERAGTVAGRIGGCGAGFSVNWRVWGK